MRGLRFLIALSVISTAMLAADSPFVGTWKLNVAKSKFAPIHLQARRIVAGGCCTKVSYPRLDSVCLFLSIQLSQECGKVGKCGDNIGNCT